MSNKIKPHLEKAKGMMNKDFLVNASFVGLVLACVLFFGIYFWNLKKSSDKPAINQTKAEAVAKDFISNYFFDTAKSDVEIVKIKETNNWYEINFKSGGADYTTYLTIDGETIYKPVNLKEEEGKKKGAVSPNKPATPAQPANPQPEPTVSTKSAKPKVELFVMSYCPYGTQTQKGIIPVVEALGDKIDFQLKFVYYAMHDKKELAENLNQYCIQKQGKDKLISYLKCFLKEDKSEQCIGSTGVDKSALTACVASADQEFGVYKGYEDKSTWLSGRFPLFNVNAEDNKKYNVGGSPTLVINGANVSAKRDPASLLKLICSGFDKAPAECGKQLSSDAPSPGFGDATTPNAGAAAGCGS